MTDPRSAKTGSGNIRTSSGAARAFDIVATLVFWIGLCLLMVQQFKQLYPLIDPESSATSLRIDFVVFWATGKLTLAGQPLMAFDPDALFAASELSGPPTAPLLWLYPASFAVMMMPFGALPFSLAYPAFILTSITAFALAVRGPASVLPGLWRLLLVSPAVVYGGLFVGQTSVLWTAGLIAALWAMQRGNAVAAGFAIALLTMKPQLGLLIPVALIAAQQWRVIGWATMFTLLITGAAMVITGPGYWEHFLASLGSMSNSATDEVPLTHLISSFYGLLRISGVAHDAAIISQFALTACLIAMVGWVWSRPGLSVDLKCATLCGAIPLATPYAYYYEMAILLAVALFLIRDGFGQRLSGKAWLLVLWFGAAVQEFFPELVSIALYEIALYEVVIMLVTVAICVVRVHRRLSTVRGGAPLASLYRAGS